jgi:very-short-patch-repair endonuclease
MKNGEGKPRIIRLSHINSIPIKVNSQAQMKKYLVDFKDYLMREITPAEGVSSMAIRDELVEAVNKYLYLDYMV